MYDRIRHIQAFMDERNERAAEGEGRNFSGKPQHIPGGGDFSHIDDPEVVAALRRETAVFTAPISGDCVIVPYAGTESTTQDQPCQGSPSIPDIEFVNRPA